MLNLRFRLSGVFAILVLLLPAGGLAASPALSSNSSHPSEIIIDPAVKAALVSTGQAKVIINLADPAALLAPEAERLAAVEQVQAEVLAQLPAKDFSLVYRFIYAPSLAGAITPEGLDALLSLPHVVSVGLDLPVTGHLSQSLPALGADVVHNSYGLTGSGVNVAVLDSGIDTDHPDLSDDIVATACFAQNGCSPSAIPAEDENGHGTNVAGVITSGGRISPIGFAPDAGIVAVRVLGSNNTGFVSDWIRGLDWIIANRSALNIRIVNMSLGTFDLYPGGCEFEPSMQAAATDLAQLAAAGVTVFASTGNQGSANAISSPACISSVIAVGATYDSDMGREPDNGTYNDIFHGNWPVCFDGATSAQTVACFSNNSIVSDIAAPGARITSAGMGGGSSTYMGTSQASPTAAGVAALMLQSNGLLKPAEIEQILKNTGTPLLDPKSGRQIPEIHALRAVLATNPPTVSISGPITGRTQETYVFTATASTSFLSVPVIYTWQASGQATITHTAKLSDTITYTWPISGVQHITVTATNSLYSIANTHAISLYQKTRAGFDYSPASGVAPLAVDFTNTSTGDYDTCTWSFGDSHFSSACSNQKHVYRSPGVYAVGLSLSGKGGSDTFNIHRAIFVGFSGVITPSGGVITSTYDSTVYAFPANAFTGTVTVTHIPRDFAGLPLFGYLYSINHIFETRAVYSNGQPAQPVLTYTISVAYTDTERGPAVEQTLGFYTLSGSQWARAAASSANTRNKTVSVSARRLGAWAILGEVRRVYIPVLQRAPSGP